MSVVKVPRDMSPARVYFFALLICASVCTLAILVKEMSNFGNSCIETEYFGDFGLEKAKNWQLLSGKCQLMALLM